MSSALRLGLYYAALFLGSGASGPYIALWFRAHGLSGAEIGLILAAPAMGRAVTGPLVALWADGFVFRRTPLVWLALGAAAAYAALLAVTGFWALIALWFVAASLFANISPLTDVIALRRARTEGFNYGWPRGIGSAAFVAGNVGMGQVLNFAPPTALLVWMIVAAIGAAAAALWLLPPDRVHEAGERVRSRDRARGMGALLADPVFMLAVGACGLIQASHAFYNSFSTLVWRAGGLAPWVPGALWGLGVTVEVAFLWFMEPWRRRVGAERLVILGALGAAVRWTCFAMSPPLWLIVALQVLHALSFTATFIGSLQLMERLAPAEREGPRRPSTRCSPAASSAASPPSPPASCSIPWARGVTSPWPPSPFSASPARFTWGRYSGRGRARRQSTALDAKPSAQAITNPCPQ